MNDRPHVQPGTDTPRRDLPSTPPVKAVRLLTRNGNSLTVSVPGIFQRALGMYEGDRLELILDREWGGFFVRPVVSRGVHPVTPEATDRLSEVA